MKNKIIDFFKPTKWKIAIFVVLGLVAFVVWFAIGFRCLSSSCEPSLILYFLSYVFLGGLVISSDNGMRLAGWLPLVMEIIYLYIMSIIIVFVVSKLKHGKKK